MEKAEETAPSLGQQKYWTANVRESCDNLNIYTLYSLVAGAGYDVEKLGVN